MASSLSYSALFTNRKIFAVFLLGFASGLPFALSGMTLSAWALFYKFNLSEVTFLSLAGQAYLYKFLWAPVVDRFTLLPIGRRRGWILITQICICVCIGLLGSFSTNLLNLDRNMWLMSMAAVASLIAFFSATLDLASDALRNDCVSVEEQSITASLYVMGYRIAMLISGGFTIIGAAGWASNDLLGSLLGFSWQGIGWGTTFLILTPFMALGIVGTMLIKEPTTQHQPNNIVLAIQEALSSFFSRQGAVWLLLFMVLYKFGEAYAGRLILPAVKEMGFSLADYSIITKFVGGAATIFGMYLAKIFMDNLGFYKTLWLGGILQALSLIGFCWLVSEEKSYIALSLVLGLENISGGIGTMALIALNMRLTDSRFSATQLAIFSAAEAFSRVYNGAISGFLPGWLGWEGVFKWQGSFLIGIALSIPALVILYNKRSYFLHLKH